MTNRSEVGRKSKKKGKRYESRVAKLLGDFTKVNFRKVPGSGGFNKAGGVKVADYVFCGDVICDRRDFRFSVEAKSRKTFSFVAILKDPQKAAFTEWWKQCIDDAKSINKLAIMFFKPDTQEDFVALTGKGMKAVGFEGPHYALNVYPDDIPTPNIIRWKTFIGAVEPALLFGEDDGVLRQEQEHISTSGEAEASGQG
jgi:hypothetical protein